MAAYKKRDSQEKMNRLCEIKNTHPRADEKYTKMPNKFRSKETLFDKNYLKKETVPTSMTDWYLYIMN